MKHNTSSKEQHKKGPNRFNEKQINVKNKIQVRWNSARRTQPGYMEQNSIWQNSTEGVQSEQKG